MIGVGVSSAGVPIVPMIWYRLQPGTSYALANVLQRPVTSFEDSLVASGDTVVYQPPQDPALPAENRLVIEKIGVDTQILEAPVEEYEEVFRNLEVRMPFSGSDAVLPVDSHLERLAYIGWLSSGRSQKLQETLVELYNGRISVLQNKK